MWQFITQPWLIEINAISNRFAAGVKCFAYICVHLKMAPIPQNSTRCDVMGNAPFSLVFSSRRLTLSLRRTSISSFSCFLATSATGVDSPTWGASLLLGIGVATDSGDVSRLSWRIILDGFGGGMKYFLVSAAASLQIFVCDDLASPRECLKMEGIKSGCFGSLLGFPE